MSHILVNEIDDMVVLTSRGLLKEGYIYRGVCQPQLEIKSVASLRLLQRGLRGKRAGLGGKFLTRSLLGIIFIMPILRLYHAYIAL